MNNRRLSLSTNNMVASSKNRNKVLSCSTPEHEAESPSRDSDSLCDSEAASPVPFLCTQDGVEGETDVVWNYYTPRADHTATSRLKNTTPLSRKAKKYKKTIIEKPQPRRRVLRSTQKKTELFQDLIELNQNLHKFKDLRSAVKCENTTERQQSGSEDDIFNCSPDCSPKSGLKTNSSRCLRKNLLSSKFNKPDPDTALESDDSMNECLIKASQIVEENILPHLVFPKQSHKNDFHDSMDSLLNNIKLDSPLLSKSKKFESPCLKNDSFDSFVGNLNDSALERLTQMPVKNVTPVRPDRSSNSNSTTNWTLKEVKVYESPSNTSLARHSSMPESPSVTDATKPSTSGVIFGRYNSLPTADNNPDPGDSPIRCTPDEIRKKHLHAREKLMAKRLLPFTCSQQSVNSTQDVPTSVSAPKKPCFQPKVARPVSSIVSEVKPTQQTANSNQVDLKKLIEKKRQEALMKLRRKQTREK
ncbi:unnamed protein product [Plutella xylostella]|uniref:(diamondback moth) hypothetical protein n=1 Tax=Plutella xylostella TaxID=51655 RepID=A0A8S4FW90_PLUXY|nr:unnamed protein product [Plutella xylostella]